MKMQLEILPQLKLILTVLLLIQEETETSLTEYYDLVYEYKNDYLTAGIKYKKTYYNDRDVKPNEDLLFTITLFPLTINKK